MNGDKVYDWSGYSVSTAGDINGDGYDDIIIGKPERYGEVAHVYVYFGKASGYTAEVDLELLNGYNGFALVGAANDHHGFSVSNAGDVNGDGYDDMLVGAPQVEHMYEEDLTLGRDNIRATTEPGEVWLVYGKKSGYKASTRFSSLSDSEGFRIEGIDAGDKAGFSVNTAGDVNKDGYDDIIIGAPGAANKKGESYVIFGGDFTGDSTITGSSSDDLITVSSTSIGSAAELRDNPLTPGNTVNTSSETHDLCLGSSVPVTSYQGNRSDLFSQYAFLDSLEDDDQQDV